MRVDLKVTHTPDLKSKLPWPRLAWQGNQVNNVLLMDVSTQRLKVLCLTESGKGDTKKKVTRLQSHLQQICVANLSACGNYLVCLLHSCDVLVWHKDTDRLQTIHGIPELVTHNPETGKVIKSSKPQLYISQDACKLLVVIGCSRLFLWEIDQSAGASLGKQTADLKGRWSHIGVCDSHTLPSAESKETGVHAQFFTDVVLGECCLCSFVFNRGDQVHVTSVILRWTEPWFIYSLWQPRFTAQWDSIRFSLSALAPGCRSVRHHGAYVIRHSHHGNTLAVAANQRSPYSNKLVFLSVMASGAVVVDLKGCGCTSKKPNLEYGRSYWICDLSWTSDDLFVVCITKRGSLAILSRLGEPLVLQSEGRSVEHGPAYFIPFHPLITVVSNKHVSTSATWGGHSSPTSSIKSEADDKRQRFSVTTHPSKPKILCSDGYLATIIELPENLTCTSLMTDFLGEGKTALNLLGDKQELRLSMLGTPKLKNTIHPFPQQLGRSEAGTLQHSDSSSPEGLVSTVGSGIDTTVPFSNLDEGKIVFGFPIELESTQRGTLKAGCNSSVLSVTSQAQRALFSTWGLGLSEAGPWSSTLDHLLGLTAKSIIRLCEILLHSSLPLGRRSSLPLRSTGGTLNQQNNKEQRLQRVSILFQDAMTSFLWDMNHCHSQTIALNMAHGMVRALLRHSRKLPSWLAPNCCVAILQFSEKLLANVYTMVPCQQPTCDLRELYFHQGDATEAALFSLGNVTPQEPIYMSVDGSERAEQNLEPVTEKAPIKYLLGKRLIRSWKLLHDHLAKHYTKVLEHRSSNTRGCEGRGKGSLKTQRQLLVLLCGVQRKLHYLGWNVPLSFSQHWVEEINKGFLKGCEWYINGYIREAIHCWQLTTHQAQAYQTTNSPSSTTSSSGILLESAPQHGRQVLGTPLVTASLVAILYTHLEHYDLMSAVKLVDKLIHCYQGDSKVKGHRTKKGVPNKLVRTSLSFLETIRKSGKVHFTAVLPCVPLAEHRSVVACLARWMAMYFTNQPLYIYPACSAKLLSSLIPEDVNQSDTVQARTLPLYHGRISSAIREQELSEVWTADSALALLLVCGLIPEAVWLARELGDWKCAFALSTLYSQQNAWVTQPCSSFARKAVFLPEQLNPDSIMKEGLSSLLQTLPNRAKHERRSSMGGMNSSGDSLHVPSSGVGMKKSSSMCSIHDEDKSSQEQLSRSLTDMLTAATLIGLDPTLWLLGNLTDACISLVGDFNTLVPEDFYLPAPPYYCPQPKYIPKKDESEQVLHEVRIRREINDVIQHILLVLNSSKCSLPCAKWYVQKLGELLQKEAKRKKTSPRKLPEALASHTKYQLDLMEGISKRDCLPPSLSKLLQCFRNLGTIVWLLHARDKLSMAIRKYQARREKSLRVRPEDPAEAIQHKFLLMSIIEWASCLHPFINFLQMEDEIQDILLTAISELPTNKSTVVLLAKHFHSGQDALYPAVLEKFTRLVEKLKRKREVVDKSLRRRGEGDEAKSKTTVKYETLYRYYKRQCQRRKLDLNDRRKDYSSLEEQIFDTEESRQAPQAMSESSKLSANNTNVAKMSGKTSSGTSFIGSVSEKRVDIVDDREEEPMSPRQAAHSHPKQKRIPRQKSFSEEDDLRPCVGSREFESTDLFLDFLETFFLVAFGKIAQNVSPSTKPDVPLLGMFSDQARKEELDSVVLKMLSRQKSKIELDISSTLNLPVHHNFKNLDAEDADTEDEERENDDIVNKVVCNRGLFYVLGKIGAYNDNLLNESVGQRLFSKYGYNAPLTSARKDRSLENSPFTGSFLHTEMATPYANVRLNLGKKYQKHVDLLQWLSRWTERQQRMSHRATVGQQESKVVLRVKLPQQLLLNSLWLLENCYHPDLFQPKSFSADDVIVMTASEDTTSLSNSLKVRFATETSRQGTQEAENELVRHKKGQGGKKKGKKDEKVVQARLKPSSSSEEEKEDKIPRETSSQDTIVKVKNMFSRKKIKEHKYSNRLGKDPAEDNIVQAQLESAQSGDTRDKEKKKKRHLPMVTPEHLSTAVDYKTEAEKARSRFQRQTSATSSLRTFSAASSLRASPADMSQWSMSTRMEGDKITASSRTRGDVHDRNTDNLGQRHGHQKSQNSLKNRSGVRQTKMIGSEDFDSDSDSSSLNVSSLDKDEIAAVFQKEIGPTVGTSQPSLQSSGDVRKMVRQEFQKIIESQKSILQVQNQNSVMTSTTASNPRQPPELDASSLLHPQAQMQDMGTQAPQPLLHTWHGEQSMLHHQSLGGVHPVHRSQMQGDRYSQDLMNAAATKDTSLSTHGAVEDSSRRAQTILRDGDTNLVLQNQQGSQDNQSAIISLDSSGSNEVPLTLKDLDSVHIIDTKGSHSISGQSGPIGVINEVHLNGCSSTNGHGWFLEGNRNNNANHPSIRPPNSQNLNSINQNELDEYDTIPTRDSDEFVPTNSTNQEITSAGNDHGILRAHSEPVPCQDYHSTSAFAHPEMPPLLRLNDNSMRGHDPRSYHPPPPLTAFHNAQNSRGYSRQGWDIGNASQPNMANVHPQINAGPYVDFTERSERMLKKNNFNHPKNHKYNSNTYVPSLPLLNRDPRGPPMYHPPPDYKHVTAPRDPLPKMQLLTLNPRPSPYYVPAPHPVAFPPNLPYDQTQIDTLSARHPVIPTPMPLLHLDEPFQPYLFKSSRGGVGTVHLIPPEEIIAFEQQKYRAKVERLKQQQREAAIGHGQEDDGMHSPQILHLEAEEEEEGDLEIATRSKRKNYKDTTKLCIKEEQLLSRKTRTKDDRRLPSMSSSTSDDDSLGVEDVSSKERSRSKPVVMLMDNLEEGNEPEESYNYKSADDSDDKPERALQVAVIDEDVADRDIGNGYVIKPGSYDSMLDDQDAHPALPTSAEIHLNIVRKLQERPQTTSRDAGVMTTQCRDVATSMDGNGLSRDAASRFGSPQDPVSQYTTAATGVSDTGHIVAPEIFFSLRFANKPDNQPNVTSPGESSLGSSKPPDKGRDFISVVDIDSDAVEEILQQPEQSPLPAVFAASTHDPAHGDTYQGAIVSNTDQEPSVAELHYNSLFHRDAQPEGLSPLSTQRVANDQAGPDPVTTKLLQARPKRRSVQAVRSRSQSAREQSKQRMYQRLAEMAQQLDAINEVSNSMKDDFKHTKLMMNTVENLSDTMVSGTGLVHRPTPDHELSRPVSRDYESTKPPSRSTSHHPTHEEVGLTTSGRDKEDVGVRDDKKMHVTIREGQDEEEVPEKGPTNDIVGDDVLGLTGLSGVSDIIAEALDDEDAKDLGIAEETRLKLQAKRDNKKHHKPDLDAVDYLNLSSSQLCDILTPRSQHTPNDDEEIEDFVPSYAKKPSQRTEAQRRELKEWTVKKQAKNMTEYKKKREAIAEREPRRYQPPSHGQVGSTQREIIQAKEMRESKKRMTANEHQKERAYAARQLMAEILAETTALPPKHEPNPKPSSQRASKRGQTRTKPPSTGKRKSALGTVGNNRGKSVPKGTYMFIDSDAYTLRKTCIDTRTHQDQILQSNTRDNSTFRRGEQDMRVPPIQLNTSDEDRDRFDAISEVTDNVESEPVLDYTPKPYTEIVRVQRPEALRKKHALPRKQKSYGDMLRELKQETIKPGSSNGVKARQRLYGTKRVTGVHRGHDRIAPRVSKPYTQRLSEMKPKTPKLSRLSVRPRARRPQFGTATVTLNTSSRRQQVEGRGLKAEAGPRTSTPYTERLAALSNSGTYIEIEGVVSPTPKLGLKYHPKTQQTSTYVERLHKTSARAPKARHKVAYVGALGATCKSPNLQTPSPRHRPYRVPSNHNEDPWEEDLSGVSDVSPWSLSDDVKRILLRDHSGESLTKGYTTDEDFVALESLDDQDDYLASVNIRELEDIISIGSESVSNIDWSAVDKMIANVQ